MSNKKASSPVQTKLHLLTSPERARCRQIAVEGESPYKQRAMALLAVDEGTSQAEAGKRTGLTEGQVRYWLGKFRQQRLAIFPDEVQAGTSNTPPDSQAVSPGSSQILPSEEASEKESGGVVEELQTGDGIEKVPVEETVSPKKAKAGKKDKKTKKLKAAKKEKKARKTEKSKKAKKSKATKKEKKAKKGKKKKKSKVK